MFQILGQFVEFLAVSIDSKFHIMEIRHLVQNMLYISLNYVVCETVG